MVDVNCPYCISSSASSEKRPKIKRSGYFVRGKKLRVQRYRCVECRRAFSDATFSPCYKQKKREINLRIFDLLSRTVCLRDLAQHFEVNRKTIARKLQFLGVHAKTLLEIERTKIPTAHAVQFDELETFEHTKKKPLSILVVVDKKSRKVLGTAVSTFNCKSRDAKIARTKYGLRPDTRKQNRDKVLDLLTTNISPSAVFQTDMWGPYATSIRKIFPKAKHEKFKGRKARQLGLGEVKVGKDDPLKTVNLTLAIFRAKISRLLKMTWNASKCPARLESHLAIFTLFFNWTKPPKKQRGPKPWGHLGT